jgi:MFS family permease
MIAPAEFRRLFHSNRPFGLLLVSLAVSSCGDWLYNVALLAFVYERTGSATWVAVTTAARVVPMLLLGPFGGALADRWDRRRLLLGSDLARAGLIGGLAVIVALDGPPAAAPLLAALATAAGIATPPCVAACTARFVPAPERQAANGLRAAIGQAAIVVGPALGAILLALAGPATAIGIDALTFLVSFAAIAAIPAGPAFVPTPGPGDERPGLLGDVVVGARALRGSPVAIRLVAADVVCSGVYGILTVTLVMLARRIGAGGGGYGLLLAACGVGGIVGATAVGRLAAAHDWRRTLAVGLGIVGIGLALLGSAPDMAAALALALLLGVGMVVAEVLSETALPSLLGEEVLARAYGLLLPAAVAGIVAGSLVAGPLVALLGLSAALAATGLLVLLVAVLLLRPRPLSFATRPRAVALCLAATLAVILTGATGAVAAITSTDITTPVERSFTAQGQSTFVVPRNVTSVEISAAGAPGTGGGHRVAHPGLGALVYGTLQVQPGETLYPEVDVGGGEPGGGGYTAVALCPQGTEHCAGYSGLPWYLTEPLVAAGGGAAGELPLIGIGANNPGGNGGLLGADGGAGASYMAGGGGGASLTQTCQPGQPEAGGGGTAGTQGEAEGVGGTGGEGYNRGGGGGGGYFGGCGGAGGDGYTAGGGGGGGASFANSPELTDYLSAIPTVTAYGSETSISGAPAEVLISFEDSNYPTPHLETPKNVQVGRQPTFTGVLSHEADDDLHFTVKIEQQTSDPKGGAPVRVEASGVAAEDGAFTVTSPTDLPSGRYQARVVQSLIGGGNESASLLVAFTVDAEPPAISLTSPPNGSYAPASPTGFSGIAGTEEKDEPSVFLTLDSVTPSGTRPLRSYEATRGPEGQFSVPFVESLPDGTYEIIARQTDDGGGEGVADAQFTIDTTPPSISLSPPGGGTGTPTLAGTAGTATGDLPGVTVDVYLGSVAAGEPIQTLSTTAGAGGGFGAQASTLAPGTYMAVAAQLDRAGNEGRSAAVTFTVPSPSEPSSQPTGEAHSSGPAGGTHSSGQSEEAPRPAQSQPSLEFLGSPTGATGVIRVKLACGAGSPCEVTLTGTVSRKSSARSLTVARRRLTLLGGDQRTVVVPLDGPGRRLLRELGRLPVRLNVALAGGSAQIRSVTVRPASGG